MCNNILPVILSFMVAVLGCTVQTNDHTQAPTNVQSKPLPFPAQLKRTVVFLEADCAPTAEELASLAPSERAYWLLHQESKMKPESLAKVKHPHSGTGFFVTVQDDRLPKGKVFLYLVTNRHVAEPGVEDGAPCKIFNYILFSNSKDAANVGGDRLSAENLPDIVWNYSDDSSVDLAVSSFSPNPSMDLMEIASDQFVTQDMIDQKQVVEADPVLFAGLFIQYHGVGRLEPIVRTGAVAMLPSELINTTLKKPGHIFFVDAHSYGGNSGSPLFADLSGFSGHSGFDYRLLGVVAGTVPESNDFTLHVSTDFTGTVFANSGVCVIVPAEELHKILFSTKFQKARDDDVAAYLQNTK